MRNIILLNEIEMLGERHSLRIDPEYNWIIVEDFPLPPRYNLQETLLLLKTLTYPNENPGVYPNLAYLHGDLYRMATRRRPYNYQLNTSDLSSKGWHKVHFCRIEWDRRRHNLLSFMKVVYKALNDNA